MNPLWTERPWNPLKPSEFCWVTGQSAIYDTTKWQLATGVVLEELFEGTKTRRLTLSGMNHDNSPFRVCQILVLVNVPIFLQSRICWVDDYSPLEPQRRAAPIHTRKCVQKHVCVCVLYVKAYIDSNMCVCDHIHICNHVNMYIYIYISVTVCEVNYECVCVYIYNFCLITHVICLYHMYIIVYIYIII